MSSPQCAIEQGAGHKQRYSRRDGAQAALLRKVDKSTVQSKKNRVRNAEAIGYATERIDSLFCELKIKTAKPVQATRRRWTSKHN
jgi:hypothetical protein